MCPMQFRMAQGRVSSSFLQSSRGRPHQASSIWFAAGSAHEQAAEWYGEKASGLELHGDLAFALHSKGGIKKEKGVIKEKLVFGKSSPEQSCSGYS